MLIRIAIVVGLAGAVPAADGGAVPGARREPGQPEMMYSKPSGFGLPNIPAKGGAYRYRLMGVGAGVLAVTLLLTVRYLRKVTRQRTTTA